MAAAAPVVLEMDVHCRQCAKKIRKSIRDMFGVDRISASHQTGMVVVHGGDVDATMLRWLLQRAMGRPVTVLSDGGRESMLHYEGIRHMAPTHYAPHPPPYAWDRSPYAGGGSSAPYHHPYQHWATPPPPHPHPYGSTSSMFDDSIPGNSCSIM
ncbi:hypothetical protein CFC21_039868 [Triticum aestivum]|uniref:HMA domain-containing protein n=3 Tax=Triticum TaxID=4564 RepID=A0A9R1FH91_WHEAT|nr:hypothetical protein CFC21_039868 [Triticum aestivum]